MFDLYIFDLDGTLVNTEELHYMSYYETFQFFNYNEPFDFTMYSMLAHYDDMMMKMFVDKNLSISYEKFYQKKKSIYLSKLDNNLKLIDGVDILINRLDLLNIPMCIVSHSDSMTIQTIVDKLPILKKIKTVLSRDNYINKKPHSECYIKALQLFPHHTNPIGFEDSYKGFKSLDNTNITSVFVGNNNYYYYNMINPVNKINNFLNFDENNIIKKQDNMSKWIVSKIDHYSETIIKLKNSFKIPLQHIITLIKNTNNNIYLTGIGKCGHICKKSVSSWQSMGISCHYLNLPDLFHGDFGIIKENDVIIYISNSGNTNELINCAKYIKDKFKVLQIALTIKNVSDVSKYVNFTYSISEPIYEIDNINMVPSMSSVIFMMFLDMMGIYIAEQKNITVEKFQLYHPGGDLGKKSKNKIDYIVIVASGQGSRLFPLTKYIPKILVTFKNKPFIEHLIEYWQQYCSNIIIISNTVYKSLLSFYTDKYKNITNLYFDEMTGTADTINRMISNEYYNKNILFTWCDIIPTDKINIELLYNTTIFTFGNMCRYIAQNNIISKSNEGNIIGMYYIENYKGIDIYNIGDDICDVFMKNFGNFDTYNLDNLIDIGDMEKFKTFTSDMFQTRFFNKITYYDNYIIKESVNSMGDDIIKKEINWYQNNNYDFIPTFEKINDNSFKLERLDAKPLYLLFDSFTFEMKQKYLNQIYHNLELLHSKTINVDNDIMIKDILYESYDKILIRLEKIKPLLNYFSYIKKVNNIEISTFDNMIQHIKSILISTIPSEYCMIHGDCQFSNIMYSMEDKIFFIDPRGYFGNSMYGDRDYDYAKVLYALTGYDNFNNDELFSVNIDNDNITFEIKDYYNINLSLKISERIKAWVVVRWLGLAQYNSNNVIKCIVSYYNAFYWYYILFNRK